MTSKPAILTVLRRIKLPAQCPESYMQDQIAIALTLAGLGFIREYKLAPRCRIDFLCEGNVGIECKVGKPSRAAVEAQLERYAETRSLSAIILCMQRMILPVDPGIDYEFISLNCNHGISL